MGCSPAKGKDLVKSSTNAISFGDKFKGNLIKKQLRLNDYSSFAFDFVYNKRNKEDAYSVPIALKFRSFNLNKVSADSSNWKISVFTMHKGVYFFKKRLDLRRRH